MKSPRSWIALLILSKAEMTLMIGIALIGAVLIPLMLGRS